MGTDDKNDELLIKMKKIMDVSLQEHHERTKGEILQDMKEEINKVKLEIIQNMDTKVNAASAELRCEIKEIRDTCEEQDARILKCEKDIKTTNDLQRKKNIIVYGLKYLQSREEMKNQIVALFSETMQTTFNRGDIDYFRFLSKDSGKCPILVRVRTLEMKYEIFGKRRNLKDSNIYIDDDLNQEQVQMRKEMRKIMKQKREEGKKAYMRNNKLFVDNEYYDMENHKNQYNINLCNKMVQDDNTEIEEINNEENDVTNNKKRMRSPTDKEQNPSKKKNLIQRQIYKNRVRANSEGSNVTRIVSNIESKTPRKENKNGPNLGKSKLIQTQLKNFHQDKSDRNVKDGETKENEKNDSESSNTQTDQNAKDNETKENDQNVIDGENKVNESDNGSSKSQTEKEFYESEDEEENRDERRKEQYEEYGKEQKIDIEKPKTVI